MARLPIPIWSLTSAIPEVSVAILEDGITVKGTVVGLNYEAFVIGPSKRFTKESLEEIRVDMQRAWEEKILDVAAKVLHKWGEGVMPVVQRIEWVKEQSE